MAEIPAGSRAFLRGAPSASLSTQAKVACLREVQLCIRHLCPCGSKDG